MKNLVLLPSILIMLFFTSCSDDSTSEASGNANKGSEKSEYLASNENLSVDEYMFTVDNEMPLIISRSLDYSKGAHSIYVETSFDTISKQKVRLSEYFTSDETSSLQSIHYYLRNEKVIAVQEYIEEGKGENLVFVERVSYYNENEKVVNTKRRSAKYQEELGNVKFTNAPLKQLTTDRALRVLAQEGEFATNFKSFYEAESEIWLIVGEVEAGGYVSSLLINSFNSDLQEIRNNPSKYVGRQLLLDFQIRESQGGSYKLLMGAYFKQ